MLAYSLLNPYGPVHPLITLSQMAGDAVAGPGGRGFAGGLRLQDTGRGACPHAGDGPDRRAADRVFRLDHQCRHRAAVRADSRDPDRRPAVRAPAHRHQCRAVRVCSERRWSRCSRAIGRGSRPDAAGGALACGVGRSRRARAAARPMVCRPISCLVVERRAGRAGRRMRISARRSRGRLPATASVAGRDAIASPSLDRPWPEASDARRGPLVVVGFAGAASERAPGSGPTPRWPRPTSTHLGHARRARALDLPHRQRRLRRQSLLAGVRARRFAELVPLSEPARARTTRPGAARSAGDHVWDLTTSVTRGSHRVPREHRPARRGAGAGAERRVRGRAARRAGGWSTQWARDGRRVSPAFSSAASTRARRDRRRRLRYSYSRRDAQENRVRAGAKAPAVGGGGGAARTASTGARDPHLRRLLRSARQRGVGRDLHWSAARRPRRAARSNWAAATPAALDRRLVAPAASFSFGGGATRGRVFAQRLVHPVWSDLAAGQAAFLQSTTALGLEAEAAAGRAARRATALMGGTTRDRAIVFPVPDRGHLAARRARARIRGATISRC